MPKLGMTMTEGRLMKWEKAEGAYVHKGEVLFCVATDKVSIDIEAPEEGVLIKILCDEGDTVPVGSIVARIGTEGETVFEGRETASPETTTPDAKGKSGGEDARTGRNIRATPAARAFAKRSGVEMDTVSGSGSFGRILRKDVEAFVSAGAEAPQPRHRDAAWEDVQLSPVQEISARKMLENFTTIPHFYITVQADVSVMIKMLECARASREKISADKATFTDVLTWVLSRVIPEHPKTNAAWTGERPRIYKNVNIGIATDTDQGLVVPVIHDSACKTFSEIAAERERLVAAARKGKLLPDDLAGGTFTVSNLGMFGVHSIHAILNAPQSALLAVGGITKTLVKEYGNIVEKPLMNMSLSCDHRVLDGAAGAKFLKRLKEVMEEPAKLLDTNLF
jgi:pyruvate dehydrogenase E2 component (dihydrolipoamide acetyltransferase)